MGGARKQPLLRLVDFRLLHDLQTLSVLCHDPKRSSTWFTHVRDHAGYAQRTVHLNAQLRVR